MGTIEASVQRAGGVIDDSRLPPVRPRTTRRRDGSVRTSYTFRYRDLLGRRRRITRSSYDDALKAWLQVKGLRERGRLADLERGTTTLACFHDEVWLLEHAPTLRPRTVEQYERLWRRHVVGRIDRLQMRDVTPRVVSALKRQMLADGVGVESTRRTLTMLQGLFRLAMEWEEASTNPFGIVRKPPVKPPTPVRPLSVEAVERLRRRFIDDDKWDSVLLVALMSYAGLRPSEVAGLRVSDVRERTLLVHRTIRPGDQDGLKNGSPYRTAELLQPVKEDIALALDRRGFSHDLDAPLVPDSTGHARDLDDHKNWRRRCFGPAVRDLDLPIRRPYDLRHTCASLLLAAQRNILEIAAQLGHRPEMTLRTYGHLIDEYRGQPPIDIEQRIRATR